MRNGKYSKRRRGVSSKALVLTLVVMLVVGCTIGGTLAWLTDKTAEVKNTFAVGDVDISLTESKLKADGTYEDPAEGVTNQYKLIPGQTYKKDPTVTVKGGSEECYLFVKFEEKGNAATYITYTSLLATPDWTQGDGTNIPANVWYRTVPASTADTTFKLLANDTITINATAVTKDTMTAASSAELVYTAYACQTANITLENAWAQVSAAAQNP